MAVTQRKSSDRPGRSVEAKQDGIDYTAWIPAPLSPAIEFDAELARALSNAAGSLGELAGTGRNLPNPHLLLQPFLRKEAVLSSRIEGTRATITDLYAYEAAQLPLPGMAATEDKSDVREVLNYVRALNRGLELIRDYPVTLAMIEDLHGNLMTGVRGREKTPGKFRVRQNMIGAPDATLKTATYIPPPVVHMQDALRDLERYIRRDNDPYPPLVRLALIHYQFEAIHPFNDGNGRVGRLLMSLLLVNWNLLSVPLLYLSAYFERSRDQYYDLLQAVTERGAWREWILYFLRGIAEQSLDAADRAKRLQDLKDELTRTFSTARASALTTHLIARLFEQPVVTVSRAAEMIDAPYHTARQHVHKLVKEGILRPIGRSGHSELFIADEILQVVDEERDTLGS